MPGRLIEHGSNALNLKDSSSWDPSMSLALANDEMSLVLLPRDGTMFEECCVLEIIDEARSSSHGALRAHLVPFGPIVEFLDRQQIF